MPAYADRGHAFDDFLRRAVDQAAARGEDVVGPVQPGAVRAVGVDRAGEGAGPG